MENKYKNASQMEAVEEGFIGFGESEKSKRDKEEEVEEAISSILEREPLKG